MTRNHEYEITIIGQQAPEFPSNLHWLNTAQPLTLADLRGKVVILEFWTFC